MHKHIFDEYGLCFECDQEYQRQASGLNAEISYLNKHSADASKQINDLAAELLARKEAE